MTLTRIRQFVAKFDGASSEPCSIQMLRRALSIIDADTEDRIQALLRDILDSEQQWQADKLKLSEWMSREVDRVRAYERYRAVRICELARDLSDAARLIADPDMHIQGGEA